MEEKSVGIVFNRKLIDYGIYLFKPECMIDGRIEKEDDDVSFIDDNDCIYLTFNDAQGTTFDEETVVGYAITVKELLKKFKTTNLKEAKTKYYEMISSKTHIGFYIIDSDLIAVMQMDFNSLMDKFNSIKIDPNSSVIEVPVDELKSKTSCNDGDIITVDDDYIAIEKEEFEKILNLKTLKKMREELQKIYDAVEEKDEEENNKLIKKEVTGQYILDLFNASLERLYEIDNLDEIKKVIERMEKVYIELTLIIGEKIKDGIDMQEANDVLYKLIDSFDEMLKLNELTEIKFELQKFQTEYAPKIKKIAEKYDENDKVEEVVDEEEQKLTIDVKEMKSFFDKKIIGQDEAKRDVISSIFMNKLSDRSGDRNLCLLVGPTGSGKTLLAETVSEYFSMPMEIIDTTQLTIPGYIGASIEDFLARLLEKAKGDIVKAESGIVVFDELDKKGSPKNEDISGKGVLNVLLPFLQGTTYGVKYNGRTVHFNTSRLTVFATGAFTDVAKGKANNSSLDAYKSTKVGYNSELKLNSNEDIKYEKLEIEDFVKYGNMPIEIMGRFSTIAQLTGHTKETLKTILTDSNISALLSEKNKLAKVGIELSWTDEYIDKIAEKALELKTGGRSLKNIVEKSIKEARWHAIENIDEYLKILLTDKSVLDNRDCILIDKNNNSINLLDIINKDDLGKKKVKVGFQGGV